MALEGSRNMEQHAQPAQPATGVATSASHIAYAAPTYQPAATVTGAPSTFSTSSAFASQHRLAYQHIQQFNQQQQQQQQQQLQAFWANQMLEVEQTADFKNHSLPLARVKKIMKADEDVRMISAEAPVVFAKACEMFILELTLRSWIHTEENKRRTLQKNDIAAAITRADIFDFLVDIVPRDELKEEGLGIPRAAMGAPVDSIPYYYIPAQHQVAGSGLFMGKHIDQTTASAAFYGVQPPPPRSVAYMWQQQQQPQAQPLQQQQQQMPDSG